jgi:D-methionine transport system ATP-binding protein
LIELKNVSKSFDTAEGKVDALKDVSITIEDGDIYGIIGMSGAGKSTLVRCINMLEKPTSGEVIVNGKRLDTMSPAQLRAARRNITMIFQQFNLLMQHTAVNFVRKLLRCRGNYICADALFGGKSCHKRYRRCGDI